MKDVIFYLSLFSPKMPLYAVYMLQQVEYDQRKFIEWIRRSPNLLRVMHRKKLVLTKRALSLAVFTYIVWFTTIGFGVYIGLSAWSGIAMLMSIVLFVLISPLSTIGILVITIGLSYGLIAKPSQQRIVAKSKELFKNHRAIKIAVAGSYGKTTMKELLATVLSEKFNIAITPGNMNTPIAHARFISKLKGDEEILVIEYGEGAPGDIEHFAQTTHPEYGIITGLAPNHLDHYETLDTLARDLFSLRDFINNDKLFISYDSSLIHKYIQTKDLTFSEDSVLGWRISKVETTIEGVSFVMKDGVRKMHIKSGLLGRHQVAPLGLVAALAAELGLTLSEVESGVAKTIPFEHRMQPFMLGGAWVIDDTYNGNLEGILAGLKLLSELEAKRKIYVTPGLVDQGEETHAVHEKIAQAIIDASPDKVVLMDNSATNIISRYLQTHKFTGEIKIESDPLGFYQGLEHSVAAGDLVLMQNDWTDNYN